LIIIDGKGNPELQYAKGPILATGFFVSVDDLMSASIPVIDGTSRYVLDIRHTSRYFDCANIEELGSGQGTAPSGTMDEVTGEAPRVSVFSEDLCY